jgi:hypothetical protein
MNIEQWELFEVSFGTSVESKTEINPFRDVRCGAPFTHESGAVVQTTGFYDGNGIYKIRFMPDLIGFWSYRITGDAPEFNQQTSELRCVPATGANHGMVRVKSQFHFAYADGRPYYPFGTTAYAWIHQPVELRETTLKTLKAGPFNKLRMCLFPKHYDYNHNEPDLYPFEGSYTKGFDFTRPNPAFFDHLEQRIKDLQDLNIECDLILFHPYDRWGFSGMGAENDKFYLKYVTARLSAFRNIWWSMANEYDLFSRPETRKNTIDDWERLAGIVSTNDPYKHLNSIHNWMKFYDYTKPWISHCSIQRIDRFKTAEHTDEWRSAYGKPVVIDLQFGI